MDLEQLLRLLPSILFISFSLVATITVNPPRYSLKKSLYLIIPVNLVLLIINLIIWSFYGENFFDLGLLITLFIPQAIGISLIGKKKGIYCATALLNAFMVVYLVFLIKNAFVTKFNYLATEYIIYAIFLPTLTYFLKAFYYRLQNLIEKNSPKMIYILLLYALALFTELFIFRLIISSSTKLLRVEIFGVAIFSIYVISIGAFYIIMNQYDKKASLIKSQQIIDREIHSIEQKIKIREDKENELRILRHDIRHILITISSLIKSGRYIDALDMSNQYANAIEATKTEIICKDPIINSILEYYSTYCEEQEINLEFKINNFEDALRVPSTELAVFISNCLDNAINAALKLEKDKRNIQFKFINNDDRLVMQIKNNYNGKILLDHNNNPTNLASEHGFGTSSINLFAKKYNLILTYDINENDFAINILFN